MAGSGLDGGAELEKLVHGIIPDASAIIQGTQKMALKNARSARVKG
jgi:hypothetical protein